MSHHQAAPWLLAAVLPFALLAPSAAASPSRLTIADLQVGAPVSSLPSSSAFRSYACGSNGGPPTLPLLSFADYRRCAPEPDGLREVVFEYDKSAEEAARAAGDYAAAWGLGTSFEYFPIIPSALFDNRGVLRGLRIVTDPRPVQRKDPFLKLRPRAEHYLLQLYLMERFGMRDTDCKDRALPQDQKPVLGMAVNRICTRSDARTGMSYRIEARFYRRKGEADIDPATGRLSQNQFVSETRAEIRSTVR